MSTIKKILAPTDFSESAERASMLAAEFGERFGAEVCLMHVYQLPVYALPDVGAPGALPPEVHVELPRQLEQMLEGARGRLARSGLTLSTKLVEGIPYQEITRHAEEWKADLIVMGTQGRTGLSHLLIGSVAERVVRTATCPVLSVRTPGS